MNYQLQVFVSRSQKLLPRRFWRNAAPNSLRFFVRQVCSRFEAEFLNAYATVEFHELGQKVRILGQGQEQDSSVD